MFWVVFVDGISVSGCAFRGVLSLFWVVFVDGSGVLGLGVVVCLEEGLFYRIEGLVLWGIVAIFA